MTITEELYQLGIPKDKCSQLAKIVDAAVVSGAPDALDRILAGLKILIQKKDENRLANYSTGLLKKMRTKPDQVLIPEADPEDACGFVKTDGEAGGFFWCVCVDECQCEHCKTNPIR